MELNELLANLREAYRDLEATKPLRELGQSTAFINHEIKNYMMVISGYAVLLQRSKSLEAKERAMADNIAQTVAKLQNFSMGVFEQSKSKIAHEDIEFELVEKIKSCIDTNFSEHSPRFTVDCTVSDGAILVNGSPGKIERVFANAFRNSFEAGAKSIRVRLSVHNYMALIAIEDDGNGCDPALLQNLSTTFFTTKPSGIGLGLCVMRSTVEAHGGNISIYSKNLLDGKHGLSLQIVIPASKKMSYSVAKSEVVLVREGFGDTAGMLEMLKNLKIFPRTVETAAGVETAPKSAALGVTVLASANIAAALWDRPKAEGGEGVRILSLEKGAGGVMLVRDAEGGVDLFTEDYIVRYLCN